MRVASQQFWFPKDIGYENEYEDAAALDAAAGVAAVADGVSSAIFSGQWAKLLVDGIVQQPPDVEDASFWEWVNQRRVAWRESINFTKLSFAQMGKLRLCGGGFTTLLWLTWYGSPDDAERICWKAVSLGDCGLFHIRNNTVLRSWPITHSSELAGDPQSVCSVDLRRDQNLSFTQTEGEGQVGDVLVLCTDAWYGWALRRLEAEQPVPWQTLADWSQAQFDEHVKELRGADSIRIDDTTLIVLRLEPEPAENASEDLAELVAIESTLEKQSSEPMLLHEALEVAVPPPVLLDELLSAPPIDPDAPSTGVPDSTGPQKHE